MGVASFRRRTSGRRPVHPDWVAAPVDHATGTVGRAMVAIGTGPSRSVPTTRPCSPFSPGWRRSRSSARRSTRPCEATSNV